MKLKFKATSKDLIIFIIFAIFLLYIVCLAVLNIPQLAGQGTLYGLNPIEAFTPKYLMITIVLYIIVLIGLLLSVGSYFFEFETGLGLNLDGSSGGYSNWAKDKEIKEDKGIYRVEASQKDSKYAGTPLICDGHSLWVDNGEYHNLIIGSTGCGKTQCIIYPMLQSLAKNSESMTMRMIDNVTKD